MLMTQVNRDYNELFPTLPQGLLRHADHRFEWSRSEFKEWVERNAERFEYEVRLEPVGPLDEVRGAPSQMAIFARKDAA